MKIFVSVGGGDFPSFGVVFDPEVFVGDEFGHDLVAWTLRVAGVIAVTVGIISDEFAAGVDVSSFLSAKSRETTVFRIFFTFDETSFSS